VRTRVLVGLLLTAPLLLSVPAQASTIAAQRREARAVQSRLDQSRRSLEPIIQSYDLARLRLRDSESRLTYATAEMHAAQRNLVATRRDLANALRAQYEQPPPDATAMLLGAGSISEMLDTMSLYARTRGYFGRSVAAIGTWKKAITAQQDVVQKQTLRRRQAFTQLQQSKGVIERTIARNRRTLRGLTRSIRRALAEQRRKQRIADALAARRARDALARYGVHFSLSTLDGLNGGGSSVGIRAAKIALSYLGTPYVWGAESPGAFDCSGLMQWAYSRVGVQIPRVTSQQIQSGIFVPRDRLAPGDLVFFDGGHHVGMYLGQGAFVQAPHTGDVVKVSTLNSGYYASEYFAGIRVYA
jgi:cell wall-associated NlpC family hydrolase